MTGAQGTEQALADIDRKLRELQQALSQVSEAPPPPPPAGHAPARPAAPAEGDELVGQAAALAAALERHIRVLVGLQDELERSTRELAEAFGRASSAPPDQRRFQGVVMIDVGPFADIGALGTFEHGLATMGVADDVHVRSYEGSRALVHLRLDEPAPLLAEMSRALPFDFEVTAVSGQELTIELAGGADG